MWLTYSVVLVISFLLDLLPRCSNHYGILDIEISNSYCRKIELSISFYHCFLNEFGGSVFIDDYEANPKHYVILAINFSVVYLNGKNLFNIATIPLSWLLTLLIVI